jgi:hypothetical protein
MVTTKRRTRELTTTERLVASLDVIRYELDRMDIAIMDAPQIAPKDRSTLRRAVAHLARRTDTLIEWLSRRRLGAKKT